MVACNNYPQQNDSQQHGDGIDATAFDYWELANYLVVEEELSKTTNIINNHNNNYDISPLMNSSITTTPSLIPSPISYFDSPLVGSINSTSFNTSPNLEPALSFFPDLIRPINMADEQQQPLLQLTTTTDIPSVTIPKYCPCIVCSLLSIKWRSCVEGGANPIAIANMERPQGFDMVVTPAPETSIPQNTE
ncbi:671_t:CDS:2 [Entrophospora sp. SA101]|nr:671_t:CDS:2 [Entrophospora sp. SA101]